MKTCTKCKEYKTFSEYQLDRTKKPGVHTQCRMCREAYKRWKRTGWSKEAFDKAKEQQNSKCAICTKPMQKAYADHCHESGQTRSLLCSNCNTLIGLAFESTATLQAAINYLNYWHPRKLKAV